eukprot:CAMPEP_0172015226 /NCGR_PEP_ID=MMETSP1041-20130122/10362_1 /TAXON_ID=464988 /ORGANISM="Hemiselmis andersenii, Strain CCMP439" /LENGTH=136 /DNA_ID=CAMNT_0012670063 /DNA_START=339 /DNA_END=749 /DNA_ORIENTATION=-
MGWCRILRMGLLHGRLEAMRPPGEGTCLGCEHRGLAGRGDNDGAKDAGMLRLADTGPLPQVRNVHAQLARVLHANVFDVLVDPLVQGFEIQHPASARNNGGDAQNPRERKRALFAITTIGKTEQNKDNPRCENSKD